MTMFKKEDSVNIDEYEITMSTESFSYTTDYQDINNICPSLQMTESGNVLLLSPSLLEEETLDVAYTVNQQDFKPIVHRGPPDRSNLTGPYNFQLEISANDTNSNKYLYSSRLNRVYIDIKHNFSIRFKFDETSVLRPMYIRATTVFSEETEAQKRVERCLQHALGTDDNNKDSVIAHNVLLSASEIGTQGEYYCGDPKSPDIWYSVLIRFPVSRSHAFRFLCKNSCPGGINRRPIDIIFTLEDDLGVVHGRQVVGARVCACPKRDINRDEKAEPGKRRITKKVDSSAKKVKLETVSEPNVLRLPPVRIFDSKILLAGMETMLHMTEHSTAYLQNDQDLDDCNKSIQELKNKIQEIKRNERN